MDKRNCFDCGKIVHKKIGETHAKKRCRSCRAKHEISESKRLSREYTLAYRARVEKIKQLSQEEFYQFAIGKLKI